MLQTGKFRTTLIVLMALGCLGFVAVVGLTASAAAADDRSGDDYERTDYRYDADERSTHFHAHLDTEQVRVAVDEETDQSVHVTVEVVEGEYDHAGRYRVDPGDSLALPTPDDPVVLRITIATVDGRTTVEVTATYDRYEVDCGDVRHGAVVATEVTYEWRTAVDGEERRWSRTATMPGVDCPEPPEWPPGHEHPDRPDRNGSDDRDSADLEDRYDDTREAARDAYGEANGTANDGYDDGRDAVWTRYERVRDHLWSGYEDGGDRAWTVYEAIVEADPGDGDEDPGEAGNETVADTTSFAERAANDTREDADRVREDVERTGDRVREDAADDAERVRNDTEDDAERVTGDAENGSERVREDGEAFVNETAPGGSDDGEGENDSTVPDPELPETPDPDEPAPPRVPDLPEGPEPPELPQPPAEPDVPERPGTPDDDGESVSADGSVDAERNGSEVTVRGSAEAGASAGGVDASVDHETGLTAGISS